ncbi:MAG: hypothetical protein QOJ58_4843, partial [Alphaproteobacteria bacterium]|nr:hypothetical protein [Alphaproteobacteria bacterium]
MKAIIGRSAVIVFVLLFGLIVFSATPSIAETLLSQFKEQKEDAGQTQGKVPTTTDSASLKKAGDDNLVAGPAT